jgi:hypothetical protein
MAAPFSSCTVPESVPVVCAAVGSAKANSRAISRSRDIVALFILVILLGVVQITLRRVALVLGVPPRWADDLGLRRNKEESETAAATSNPTNELRVIKVSG